MHLSPILVLVTIALVATNCHRESKDSMIKIEPRVIHGSLAQENYPFYVAIVVKFLGKKEFVAYCGGSLIDNQNVLTTAHCIEGIASDLKNGSEFMAYLAPKRISSFNGKKIAIDKFTQLIPHPSYEYPYHYADIGIVRLSKAENLGSSRICIGKTGLNQHVTLAGFGLYNCNENEWEWSDSLRCATGNTTNCKLPGKSPKNTICAELHNAKNQSAIQGNGDSGSPLFHEFQQKDSIKKFYAQVGIVSYSKKIGNKVCPDTRYTGVNIIPGNYMKFLMEHSRAKQCANARIRQIENFSLA